MGTLGLRTPTRTELLYTYFFFIMKREQNQHFQMANCCAFFKGHVRVHLSKSPGIRESQGERNSCESDHDTRHRVGVSFFSEGVFFFIFFFFRCDTRGVSPRFSARPTTTPACLTNTSHRTLCKVDRTLLRYQQHMNISSLPTNTWTHQRPVRPVNTHARPSSLRPDLYSAYYVLYAATTPTPPSIDNRASPFALRPGYHPNMCCLTLLHRKSVKYSSGQRLVVRPDRAAGLCEALLPVQLNTTASCVERRPGVVTGLHAYEQGRRTNKDRVGGGGCCLSVHVDFLQS